MKIKLHDIKATADPTIDTMSREIRSYHDIVAAHLMAICSFLSAEYSARTAIEIETASPCAIAAKTTTIMVTAVAAFTAAHAMLRAIHMRCWRSAVVYGVIGVCAAIVIIAVKFLWVL
jgi:hypothetical protein